MLIIRVAHEAVELKVLACDPPGSRAAIPLHVQIE
jgi:hypothetical protein